MVLTLEMYEYEDCWTENECHCKMLYVNCCTAAINEMLFYEICIMSHASPTDPAPDIQVVVIWQSLKSLQTRETRPSHHLPHYLSGPDLDTTHLHF